MDKQIDLEVLKEHNTSELLRAGNDSFLDKLCLEAWQQASQKNFPMPLTETAGLIALGVIALGVGSYYAGKRLGLGSITGLQRLAESREYFAGLFKRPQNSLPENNAYWALSSNTEKIYSSFKIGDLQGYHTARGISEIPQPKQSAKIEGWGELTKRFRSTFY